MSPESLAKARLEVIEGEALEEVRGETRCSELKIRTLWSYTSLTQSAGTRSIVESSQRLPIFLF